MRPMARKPKLSKYISNAMRFVSADFTSDFANTV